jgi:hypothetical protein
MWWINPGIQGKAFSAVWNTRSRKHSSLMVTSSHREHRSLHCYVLDHVYRAVAWQRVDQIRYSIMKQLSQIRQEIINHLIWHKVRGLYTLRQWCRVFSAFCVWMKPLTLFWNWRYETLAEVLRTITARSRNFLVVLPTWRQCQTDYCMDEWTRD